MVDEFGWQRRAMVSALTMLGLDEMQARYASYQDLAETIRFRFRDPKATLHELFGRLTFNILVGNVDRSEEHTSELQSLMRISYAVFCLKKKMISHAYNST